MKPLASREDGDGGEMPKLRRILLGVALAAAAGAPAAAQEFDRTGTNTGLFGIFDEVRLGGSFSVEGNADHAPLFNGQVLFTTFVPPFENYIADTLLRPRPHFGGTVSTGDGVNQVFGGLTWNFPIYRALFIEASFGGTIHDGPLESAGDGPDLGCNLLFRESIGVGVDLGPNWRVLAAADHSSHADLCEDGGNSGLTHAGLYVGYRF